MSSQVSSPLSSCPIFHADILPHCACVIYRVTFETLYESSSALSVISVIAVCSVHTINRKIKLDWGARIVGPASSSSSGSGSSVRTRGREDERARSRQRWHSEGAWSDRKVMQSMQPVEAMQAAHIEPREWC
jgi:hypothetical protein